MAGQSVYELRNANKRLNHHLTLAEGRERNLRELIRTYEKRLDRMAERLTGLAAERNTLYADNKECIRVVNRLRNENEDLMDRLTKVEWELDEAHTIKGSRP